MTISLGNFLTDLQSSTTEVMAGVAPVATLVIGILLAFWLIGFVIDMITLRKENENETMGG